MPAVPGKPKKAGAGPCLGCQVFITIKSQYDLTKRVFLSLPTVSFVPLMQHQLVPKCNNFMAVTVLFQFLPVKSQFILY
jgi:hypothetical protein